MLQTWEPKEILARFSWQPSLKPVCSTARHEQTFLYSIPKIMLPDRGDRIEVVNIAAALEDWKQGGKKII